MAQLEVMVMEKCCAQVCGASSALVRIFGSRFTTLLRSRDCLSWGCKIQRPRPGQARVACLLGYIVRVDKDKLDKGKLNRGKRDIHYFR